MPLITIGAGRTLLRSPAVAAAAGADFAFIIAKSGTATTAAIDTTGADLLVVSVAHFNTVTGSVSDSKSNTWQPLTVTDNGSFTDSSLFYCVGGTVGSGHTFTINSATGGITAAAFSCVGTATFDNEAGGSSASSATLSTSGITPNQNNSLVIFGGGMTGTLDFGSITGGFNVADTISSSGGVTWGSGLAYLIQTTAAAADPDWTISGSADWSARIASFKSV